MTCPHDPFNRSRLPATFDREGRVRLLGEAALDLLEGRMPSTEARMFLGGALLSWLQSAGALGALERDFLQVAAPHRSTMTPGRLWQRGSSRRATDARETDTMPPNPQPVQHPDMEEI